MGVLENFFSVLGAEVGVLDTFFSVLEDEVGVLENLFGVLGVLIGVLGGFFGGAERMQAEAAGLDRKFSSFRSFCKV